MRNLPLTNLNVMMLIIKKQILPKIFVTKTRIISCVLVCLTMLLCVLKEKEKINLTNRTLVKTIGRLASSFEGMLKLNLSK